MCQPDFQNAPILVPGRNPNWKMAAETFPEIKILSLPKRLASYAEYVRWNQDENILPVVKSATKSAENVAGPAIC